MTTTENADSISGRVTRSLRKRLTSVDSDASNRPGTPILQSLQTVPELCTPSKRITRRTSLSTPAATPSKTKSRLENVEVVNSPARRGTRRGSLSIREQEEIALPTKSKEPSIDAFKEEETTQKSPKVNNKRVTRSSSKSPQESLPMPKTGRKRSLQKSAEPEQEVINLEDSTEVGHEDSISPATVSRKESKVRIKKEESIDEMIVDKTGTSKESKSTPIPNNVKDVSTPLKVPTKQKDSVKKNCSTTENSEFSTTKESTDPNTPQKKVSNKKNHSTMEQLESSTPKAPTEQNSPQKKESIKKNHSTMGQSISSPAKPQTPSDSPRKSNSVQTRNRISGSESSPAKMHAEQEISQKDANEQNRVDLLSQMSSKMGLNSSVKRLSLEKIYLVDAEISSPTLKISPQKKSSPEKLKNVEFNETSNEDTIKTVFPKTPGLKKSKSYILESFEDNEADKVNKPTDERELSLTDAGKESDKQDLDTGDHEDIMASKTPYKLKIKAVESSTPIQSASPKSPKSKKTSDVENQKKESPGAKEQTDTAVLFPKSWSHSVSGTVKESSKIDSIESEETMRKKLEEEEALKRSHSGASHNRSNEKTRNDVSSDDSDSDVLPEDDDYDESVEEEEELNLEKTIFIDDEAMEVAEGEESMDSEERAYLEENEIPVYGESIGSRDTEDEQCEDESDDEDRAFIVSDTDDVTHASDQYNSEDETFKNRSKRKNKRIRRISDSSSENNSAPPVVNAEDKDFRLILESSVEEEQNGNKKLNKDNYEKQAFNQESTGESAKEDTPKRRKSLRNIEHVEIMDQADDISNENAVNKRKSINKAQVDKTECDVYVDGDLSKKSLTKTEQNIEKNEDLSITDSSINGNADDESASANKSINKSRKSKNKSNLDIADTVEHHKHDNTAITSKRGSFNKSDILGEDENTEYTSKKSPRRSSKRSSNDVERDDSAESSNDDRNASKKDSRKSLNKSHAEEEDKASSMKQARMSLNRSNQDAKSVEDILSKSLAYTNSDPGDLKVNSIVQSLNVSRKSLNDSKQNKRNSLGRTSTEEQQPLQRRSSFSRSKLEKSFGDGSEPEEAFSDFEVLTETLDGRSLNSSRRSRKSINQSRVSLENYEEALEVEEAKFNKPKRNSMNKSMNLLVDVEVENESASNNSSYDGENEAVFSDTEVDDPQAKETERSIMEFLGEEAGKEQPPSRSSLNSSRRKSVNDSKLDETFELQSKSNLSSMHESLHRSIMRKSLNHNQLRSEVSADSLAETQENVLKKVLPERGLSVSLSSIESKQKKMKGAEKAVRNSFTIGVSVRQTHSPDRAVLTHSSESESEHTFSEQEDLDNVQNIHHVGPYKLSNSLSMSLKKPLSTVKYRSLYIEEQDASQSFVENIAEEVKKIESRKKRRSNSSNRVVAIAVEKEPQEDDQKQKQSSESEDKKDIKRILSRCDEILEAANRAKRDAKLNAKKSKVKKPKWMDKEEITQKEDEVKIPLVSKKELKRKEKIKKQLAKAIKHSTALLETVDPKLAKKLKVTQINETDNNFSSTKRLPTEFLEALSEVTQQKRKMSKEVETTPPSDKENSKQGSNKDIYDISDISGAKKKKKHDKEILTTATGTVIVEPSTPVHLRVQRGFRESPKTPIGFKIQDINSAGQTEREKSHKRGKKLFTASGDFIEEDLSFSAAKLDSKREKSIKRKRHIEEPVYSLPKTQWTTSGVFVEEDLYNSRPLANSTATQFMVTSLNGNKKNKNTSKIVSSATLNSALSFKQSALFHNNVRRETARELTHRKQRKLANNHY